MPETLSPLPLNPADLQPEDDWDHSLPESLPLQDSTFTTTPRNSIIFPVDETPSRPSMYIHNNNGSVQDMEKSKGDRTLSELLRLHSGEDSKGQFSQEEAARIADVLGQWINASSSPYEAEDDFFTRSAQSMDDLSITSKRPSPVDFSLGRPRGRSECANSPSNSRPPSCVAFIPS